MGSAEGKNKEGRKLIKAYQKKHRNLTESKDSRHMRRLFNQYGGKKGYLDEKEAKLFIKDVLFVCEMTDIPNVDNTVNAIFKELDPTNSNRVNYSELLKPSWGKVQDVLNTVYGKKMNNNPYNSSSSSSLSTPSMIAPTNKYDSSLSDSDFEKNCPPSFECPITSEIMTDPVILVSSGKTYERKGIEEWLKHHNTDPLSNEVLQSKDLLPVLALKNAIEEWKESCVNRQKEKREKTEYKGENSSSCGKDSISEKNIFFLKEKNEFSEKSVNSEVLKEEKFEKIEISAEKSVKSEEKSVKSEEKSVKSEEKSVKSVGSVSSEKNSSDLSDLSEEST